MPVGGHIPALDWTLHSLIEVALSRGMRGTVHRAHKPFGVFGEHWALKRCSGIKNAKRKLKNYVSTGCNTDNFINRPIFMQLSTVLKYYRLSFITSQIPQSTEMQRNHSRLEWTDAFMGQSFRKQNVKIALHCFLQQNVSSVPLVELVEWCSILSEAGYLVCLLWGLLGRASV